MSLLHDVIGDTDWLIRSIKMQYKLAEEPNLAICPNTALLSVTNQMPAFIPLIVSAMARCKCQMWPRPASLAPNTQSSTSSVCQNPLSANDASVFIILVRDGGVIQTSLCSAFFGLTLWNAPVGVRPGLFSPRVERQCGFHYSNKGCQRIRRTCRHWSLRANKRRGLCHPFVHVWSHISHLSLLGSPNLTEAFSRNPTDRII